jgi:NAD+ synthase (glutamine-hydrolysing)
MKIALAQLNYTIGAFNENAGSIIKSISEARANQADLVVFSELSVCGYPPLDLLEQKYFIENCHKAVDSILPHTNSIAVILGVPTINTNNQGKNLFNSALFIHEGQIKSVINKALLPTYDIFDEYRHFQPSEEFQVVHYKGMRLAITICEDLWFEQPLLTNFGKNRIYTVNPVEKLTSMGCDVIINIAASPYAHNHDAIKSSILSDIASTYKLPIFYVNQVGAQAELIFDGASRVVNASGQTVERLSRFREEIACFDLDTLTQSKVCEHVSADENPIEIVFDALVIGIHDYFVKTNFKTAVLGLSGGIDSAVTLVLAKYALGSDNIRVLLMPSEYSSGHSVTDAIDLANNLGVRYDVISIKDLNNQYLGDLDSLFENKTADITEENIQARIRGTLLMAISNKFGNLLLNTSNKSEIAVGYGTLYGDMNGALSVIGDVYKTEVYELAKFINRDKEVIPEHTILKSPSAELRPDQKDSDSLPDYGILDKILFSYIELQKSAKEIIADGFDKVTVLKVIRLVNISEYKRFQTPPILRISSKAFGFGRRMPLVAKYQ